VGSAGADDCKGGEGGAGDTDSDERGADSCATWGVAVSGWETGAGESAAFGVSRGAMRRGKTRNPTSAAAAIAPKVTGSNHGLFAACFAAVGMAVAVGVGASELELSLALALALRARSAACCAAYACTFRRTHSPGRPGSSADKRR
jgi:hypothetical protein